MADNLPIQSRPSPDALLAAATAESRGKLKIFLGAAPGVGKTFEMLQAARRKKADGIDIAVGVVETHGRTETAAMLEGLEIIPRQTIPYKGRILEEMDLDAILKRRPALVLVDELAHSNAPGCRHPKRYQDVEELLTAGIDVYSTLNIQHVESLNDIVAKITRVRVRETVPDRIVDKADDIEVVDLTPEELLERLNDGKVYVKEQAARAIRHYFQPGNLTALRELALRRTAERVDAQMVSYMRAHAIQGPWAAGERIMALIDETPAAASLIRYAKRMAERLRATWVTVHIETARDQTLNNDDRARIAANLRLAEHLGGEALSIPGGNIVSDILALAAETNVTHVILGKSKRSRWFEMLHGSVVHELVARSSGLSVHVMAADGEKAAPPRETLAQPAEVSEFLWQPYFGAALYVGMATACGLALEHYVRIHNVALVFVPAVMASAVRHGRWPGLAGAFFAMLAYNYFFLEPRHEFTISDPANLVAFVFFTVISILVSSLAARVRQQTLSARRQARTTGALYGFSRKIAGIAALDDLLWAAAYQVATMLKCEVVILLPERSGMLEVRGGFPPEDQLDDADVAAAKWAYDRDQPAGRGSDTLPGGKRLFLPLRTGRGKVGVLGVQRQGAEELLSPDERRLVDALADQIAIAIERIRLADDVDAARLLAESERLRSALLTSISHDLKTPLAAILGAITSLRQFKDLYDRDTIDELMATVQDEAERLNRFVANLLDMTRLDAGAVQPKTEIFDLGDALGAALKRTSRLLTHHKVVVDIGADLPMLKLDFVLLETVLVNLLDNSAKYSLPGSAVEISAKQTPSGVLIEIRDHGPGIPAADQARIFEKFYRAESGDRQRAGTGLGLAICRGFVESMGGAIAMRNAPDGGALFSITFPATVLAPPLPEKV